MITDSLWKLLLQLKDAVYASSTIDISHIHLQGNRIILNSDEIVLEKDILISIQGELPFQETSCTILKVNDNGWIDVIQKGLTEQSSIKQLLLYLPFCLAPSLTSRKKKALSISHFAQSLDGHIATESNHSQWIGNDENLVHAHRLRALVDGIIIGNTTLLEDQPKLTVRHVEGENPIRIVIGNTKHSEESLTSCSKSPIIRITNKDFTPCQQSHIDYIQLDGIGRSIKTADILQALHNKGIYSVLIEGGSYTSSIFLKENNIDMLQLHIAPLLFGSGIKTFKLPPIAEVGDSCSFDRHFYHTIGDAIMFTGFTND